jgi:translation initiation factor RLI1
LIEEDLKSVVKIQYVDSVIKAEQAKKGTIREKLLKADKKGLYDQVVDALDLTTILERKAVELSGGEL